MDLWQVPRTMDHLMRETLRDLDHFERRICPYLRQSNDHSILHAANEIQQVVNDDKKFALSLDVSKFSPEELDVHLEGRELTVEGKQEHSSANGFITRSFVRKWILPENVDLEAIRTQLTDKGQLCIEAPKVEDTGSKRKNIPIMSSSSSNHN